MKSVLTHTKGRTTSPVRPLAAGFVFALALLVLLASMPPFVSQGPRALLMAAFAPLCHQIAERSFSAGGIALALCHRCTGMLLGLLVGLIASMLLAAKGRASAVSRISSRAAVLLAVAFVPMSIDWGLDAVGLVANSPLSRMGTGLWAGAGLGMLLASSLQPSLEDVEPQV